MSTRLADAVRRFRGPGRALPDPTFYPSPGLAAKAPAETHAYVALIDATGRHPDALGTVDLDPQSPAYGTAAGTLTLPHVGDELHHFGWNACSSALCPYAPHPHVARRYLIVPGLRSSRVYVVDTRGDGGPHRPRLVKTIEPDRLHAATGYSRPHTVHCGPEGIYVSALGTPDGGGPGGIFLLDHDTFEPVGRWEIDRGPQRLAYDFWWHLAQDVMLTSEWGTPNMVEGGLDLDYLVNRRYGRAVHVFDLRRRAHRQALEVGPDDQMVLELRPAHDPTKAYGFVGVVTNVADLSASVWAWRREPGGEFSLTKVITIPAEPADPELLPPALKPFGAVPPLVTDIALSVDDRALYVSCWGTGELRQYDVTDPMAPRLTGSVRLGGIASRAAHPGAPDEPLNGGPQMLEVSRDGRRVYVTNSLYRSWDEQFYPDGIKGWLAKVDVRVDAAGAPNGLAPDPRCFVRYPDGVRPHQVRLGGGDASSDSYCYPDR